MSIFKSLLSATSAHANPLSFASLAAGFGLIGGIAWSKRGSKRQPPSKK